MCKSGSRKLTRVVQHTDQDLGSGLANDQVRVGLAFSSGAVEKATPEESLPFWNREGR